MRASTTAAIVGVVLTLGLAGEAFAGGPFVVDEVNQTGIAGRWLNDTLEWWADKGRLSGAIDNATGIKWVQDELDKWMSVTLENADKKFVSASTIKESFKGKVEEDITLSNFNKYYNNDPGPTAVIFDEDGSITAALTGAGNENRVVGLTMPILSDDSGLYITKGILILNGMMQANGRLSPNQEIANSLFQAAILHELGHILNLDHGQVNYNDASKCVLGAACASANQIATMYPKLLAATQKELSRDDKVTLSWIYPSDDFQKDFCTITGEVFDAKGQPLKGVNVFAYRADGGEASAKVDVRAFVSGVLKPECYGDGRYYLYGIVPGQKYQVGYEPIGAEFVGFSGFEPLSNPPQGFDGGEIQSSSGDKQVWCDKGGDTIEMSKISIDVKNPCVQADTTKDSASKAQSKTSKCSLTPDSDPDISAFSLLAVSILFLFMRRKSVCAKSHSR